ncbi:MAG: hypothetical protein JSV04_03930 [Candidatus Heimdallarchaeota archaeon]|nr:MAG: hypothetical protein JSV04_03930 [Candidatus Heimdallarchaeota archaeon]
MNLGTFGAVLKYAIQLESSATDYYHTLIAHSTTPDFFGDFKTQCEKRITILKRIRRENTTEMILEPIYGLESEVFLVSEPSEALETSNPVDSALTMEGTLHRFYLTASEKISFLSEVAFAFEDLAGEHLKNINSLKRLK